MRTCPTCQRVKTDHLPPAGLLYLLPVPTRRGGCVSLDFLELPVARSGHDLLKVHIDLLTGRVWLVPTFKTTTAEGAACNFVGSVFRDVGLPDVLVSDRDTRFTSAFWTGLHAALRAWLIYGSQHHHKTTSKVDRVNGVIADVLRRRACRRLAGPRAAGQVRDQRFGVAPREWLHAFLRRPRPAPPPPLCPCRGP